MLSVYGAAIREAAEINNESNRRCKNVCADRSNRVIVTVTLRAAGTRKSDFVDVQNEYVPSTLCARYDRFVDIFVRPS